MTVSQALEKLSAYEKLMFTYNHASGLMYYDGPRWPPGGRRTCGPIPWASWPG